MKKLIACIAALMIFALPALAVVSPGDDFYVLDKADVLTEETEGMIVFSNDLLEEDCGAQMVVVTLDSTGNDAIEDYAYELFNEWQIGDKKAQNGCLLLLAIDDEDYYFLPGTGLDYDMSGGRVRTIIDEYLEPCFAEGEYDKGVSGTFEQLFGMIADVCGSDATVQDGKKAYKAWLAEADYEDAAEPAERRGEREEAPEKKKGVSPAFIIIAAIVIVLIIVNGKNRRRRGASFFPVIINTTRRATRAPRAPRVRTTRSAAPRTGFAPRPRMGGGGRTVGGGSGRSAFGATRTSTRSTRSRSSFSSGASRSRSGFGGGRSGGGGRSRGGGVGRGR